MNSDFSSFIDLIQFHLISQMLATFSGVESERTIPKFRKRKKFLCCVHLLHKAGAVVQPRLRNVQKSVMHVQSKGGRLREVVAHGGSTVLTSGIVNLM